MMIGLVYLKNIIVDSLFKAQGDLWLCNEIHTIEYEEIKD